MVHEEKRVRGARNKQGTLSRCDGVRSFGDPYRRRSPPVALACAFVYAVLAGVGAYSEKS